MLLTKLVSLCLLTSAAVIFINVLTGRHQELADEVSSVLHQSFTRSQYEIHNPDVVEVRHEVCPSSACSLQIWLIQQPCLSHLPTCCSACCTTPSCNVQSFWRRDFALGVYPLCLPWIVCSLSSGPGRSHLSLYNAKHLQEIQGMEVVLVRSKEPRGVLMVFHGCMRRPTDWWHYESTCVTCIG